MTCYSKCLLASTRSPFHRTTTFCCRTTTSRRRRSRNPKPSASGRRSSSLTEDELARLFAAIHSVRDRAIFQLAYRAGLRASEVGLLQLRDYDPKADRIFIHRLKGSNSGHHHLVRDEARALRAWLKVRGSYPGPIFLSKRKRPIRSVFQRGLTKTTFGAVCSRPFAFFSLAHLGTASKLLPF